ncbi:uncharacterized protein LOC117743834 isoform X1 [Cyclopterus lumpus]|uniref:uncharacterized protein LOC117743834 isoform X1 n=1 Tax=Cyclopterus lumpus TaxID=8103 RepID=UPI0014869FA6|nr:uncharacterized protein LOC117743834 isoform X1 [Cyclopterus lumpus]
MLSRCVINPFVLLGQEKETPTWGERYAVVASDWQIADDSDVPESKMESEWEDFSPEKNPVVPSDGRWFSEPFSHVDLLPSPSVPVSSPASSWSSPLRDPWTRSSQRASRAAAYHPDKASGYCEVRAPVFRRRGCNGGRRRYRPRGCMPKCTSWEHLPAVIQPTKWYQVVGSMQCSHCKDQGRYQLTSWICQTCQVPLCLMPYRNCYAKWHGQRC